MSRSTVLATSVAVGGVAAALLYGSLSPTIMHTQQTAADLPAATPTVVSYANCVPPATLEGDECVTHVTKTVTVTDPPSTSPAYPGSSASTGTGTSTTPTSAPTSTAWSGEHESEPAETHSPEPSEHDGGDD